MSGKSTSEKLPQSKLEGKLFYIDALFLVTFAEKVNQLLEKPTKDNAKIVKGELATLQNCLKTHTALLSAKTDKEKVDLNGGGAIEEYRKLRPKKEKVSSKTESKKSEKKVKK